MTTFIMYDSVSANDIPPKAWAVAGYSDGRYNWPLASWERFITAYRLPITVTGEHTGARVCDCENGDLTPMGAALWCHLEIMNYHRRPTVYCNSSTVPAVEAALKVVGLQFGRDVDLWVASWDGVSVMPDLPGCVAKQYQHPPASGGNFDLSVVNPVWLATVANAPQGAGGAAQLPSDPVTTGNVDGTQVTVDEATVDNVNKTGEL